MSRKPRPAPIYEKRFHSYRLHFSFGGKQYRRFYIANENVANALQSDVNCLIIAFKNGQLALPTGITLPDFIFDQVVQKPDPDEVITHTVHTLGQLLAEYRTLSAPPAKARSTCKTEAIHLQHLEAFVAKSMPRDPQLDQIKAGLFDNYKKFRYGEHVRSDTVNKELNTFQVVFQMAVDHGYVAENVLKKVRRDKSEVPGNRFRSQAEVEQLLQSGHYSPKEIKEMRRYRYLKFAEVQELLALAHDHWLHPLLLTLACTGMRRGELAKLEWADVDFDNQCLWVRSQKQSQTKQEVKRFIPLAPELLRTLQAQKERGKASRWVFPGPNGGQLSLNTLRSAWERLIHDTKFEGLGFHVFRHSFTSTLAAMGIDQRLIDKMVGHQTEEMRQRYQHLFPQQMQEAVKKLGYV